MKHALAAVSILGLSLVATTASAQTWTWSLGVKAGPAYSSLDAAPDLDGLPAGASGGGEATTSLPVPDFTGFGGGGGVAAELIYRDVLGLEIDAQLVMARGDGTAAGADLDLQTVELHLPVLAKAQTRVEDVVVYVGVGATIIRQLVAELDVTPAAPVSADELQTDLMATLALGAKVPLTPTTRVPIELRLSTEPNPESIGDRFTVTDAREIDVDPSWTGHAWLLVGVEWTGAL